MASAGNLSGAGSITVDVGACTQSGVFAVVSVVDNARGARQWRTAQASHTSMGSPSRRPTARPNTRPPSTTAAPSSTGAGTMVCRAFPPP